MPSARCLDARAAATIAAEIVALAGGTTTGVLIDGCHDVSLRTTLTIEDRIARELKRLALRSGKSFKVVVNETLQAGLAAAARKPLKPKRYRVRPASLGAVRAGVDLDKALGLADSLEDEHLVRCMARLPTFRGQGLYPGVNLDDSASLLELMEAGDRVRLRMDYDRS